MLNGIRDRFRRGVKPNGAGRNAREIRGPVARPAARVEDLPAGGESGRQSVSGQVFCPEIVIHLAGNHSFSRELTHGVGAPIFVFTATRQSR